MQNRLLKQVNVGSWWGAFRNLGSYVSFYLYIGNTFVLLVNTFILGNMAVYGFPIPMWLVIAIVVVIGIVLMVVAMIFEHKYTLPSFMTYWNSQFYWHGNLLKERMDKREPEEDAKTQHLQESVDSLRQELRELRNELKEQK